MPEHAHLTLELLAAIEAGTAAGRPAIRSALADRCARCMAVLADYLDRPAPATVSYRGLWRRIEARLRAAAPAVEREIADAGAAFEAFARHSPADRGRLLATDPRFSGFGFVERLLDRARATRRTDPAASLAWASDAETALDLQAAPSPDQRVLAAALQANAHRAAADLLSASKAFERVRALADELDDDLGTETVAEVGSLEASLLVNLHHFDEAEALLREAFETYRELGQVTLAAQALIQLGFLLFAAHAPKAAIKAYWVALELLEPEEQPELFLIARFNLAHTLADVGDFILARDLLLWDEDLYELFADAHLSVRRDWLAGRIAAATGDPAEAEAHYLRVRDHFADRGDGFDAALVSLDLALLYREQNRTEDLFAIVSAAVGLFAAHALHTEALAALTTLRDAVHQRAATAETIERVAAFLRDAANDPAARLRPVS